MSKLLPLVHIIFWDMKMGCQIWLIGAKGGFPFFWESKNEGFDSFLTPGRTCMALRDLLLSVCRLMPLQFVYCGGGPSPGSNLPKPGRVAYLERN